MRRKVGEIRTTPVLGECVSLAPDERAPTEAYLTTGQAAKLLHVSPKTVARWSKEGKIPHLVTLGGHRRFPASAVRELVSRLHNGAH